MENSINNLKGQFPFFKINDGIGNMWAKGRTLLAHECKSGDRVEIVYEASRLFKAQYPKNLVVEYVRAIQENNINNISYHKIIN